MENGNKLLQPHYPEVLAPVGDYERLTYAVNYGRRCGISGRNRFWYACCIGKI